MQSNGASTAGRVTYQAALLESVDLLSAAIAAGSKGSFSPNFKENHPLSLSRVRTNVQNLLHRGLLDRMFRYRPLLLV